MSSIYAMQRANGDWFALEEKGRSRVPMFSDRRDAMSARAYNVELLVFKPVLLNKHSVDSLAALQGETIDFWLVDKESTNMKRGRVMNHAQLASSVNNSNG